MTSNSTPNPDWENRDHGKALTSHGAPSSAPSNDSSSLDPKRGSESSQYRTSLAQRRACYEQAVRTAIARQFPFGEADRQTLRQLQQALKLPDDDAKAISREIIALVVDKEARYQSLLQRYEDTFRRVLQENQRISDGDRWRLTQQMSQWEIAPGDAAVIEQQVRARYSADGLAVPSEEHEAASNNAPPAFIDGPPSPQSASGAAGVTQLEPLPDGLVTLPQTTKTPDDVDATTPDAAQNAVPGGAIAAYGVDNGDRYGTLTKLLQAGQWQQADDETYQCLLQSCNRVSEGWLDSASLINICPRADLLAIDRLWQRHSEGHFGFSPQREIFLAVLRQEDQQPRAPVAFGKQLGWLIWDNPLVGFKYYRQLDFTRSAPVGHLPAKWFWEIPWQQALKCGGLSAGRGGCAKDDGLLSALYDRLGETQAVG